MPKQPVCRYRLALDLGSTSLGWAIFRLQWDKQEERLVPTAIIKAGVRIFGDGRNPKDGSSLAVTRRQARGMRRRRDRLLRRKARMMNQLIQYGFFPQDEAARKALERMNPYELRAKGLKEALKPEEFARALFHINQRRGFKSNRKTDQKDDESGALKTAISHLRQALQSENCQTVGQWLWQRMEQGKSVRARYRETKNLTETGRNKIEKSYDLYIDRAMVEQEFDALWAKQAELNPALFNEKARESLKETLLHQRPLRPVKPGRCTLCPDEERAPLALPSQQRFRIYQEVNNLRLLNTGLREIDLSLEQRNKIVIELEHKKELKFDSIRTLLQLPGNTRFNLEYEKRDHLKGNATSALLSKADFFGAEWHRFDAGKQDEIIIRLLTEESEGELIHYLQQETGVNEMHAEKIANASLPDGYGSLSRKALAKILPELEKAVIPFNEAVQRAGFSHHSDLDFDFEHTPEEKEQIGERILPSTGEIKPVYVFKALPYYGKALHRHVGFGSGDPKDSEEKRFGKIANPTVHIGLNQVRTVVNALIRRYGRPAEVIIEVARDLKQSQKQKLETQKKQTENQKRNERIRTEAAAVLQIGPEQVKGRDIQKWILWDELNPKDAANRRCPYSGVQISAAMLLSGQVEIEHILPFSQTLDDSLNNKTVSMRQANRIKGNRTPWEASADFEAQGWLYEGILQRAALMNRNKSYRFAENGYEKWKGEDGNDFLARALNDTRYLSRIAATYLQLVCPGTRVIPGTMTAKLRGKFGLNNVLGLDGEKNRNDHRHHAVDACVIGVTDQGMLQKFAKANSDAREKQLERLVETMPLPWETYYDHVRRAVENIRVSHKPDHGYEGAMMEETSYGLRKDGSIKQRKKADGSERARAILNVIPITEPRQSTRHGVDAEGHPLPYKGYVGGSNYCIEITKNDKGKWEGEVISTFHAYGIVRKVGIARLRHPYLAKNGKPLVMRLIIGDCVRLIIKEKEQVMKVTGINQAGIVWMAPIHEANVDARNRDKEDTFSYVTKSGDAFRQAKARRVTISPIGELHDPGFKG